MKWKSGKTRKKKREIRKKEEKKRLISGIFVYLYRLYGEVLSAAYIDWIVILILIRFYRRLNTLCINAKKVKKKKGRKIK